jgi:hypothetical protein
VSSVPQVNFGGSSILITGTGFTAATSVAFGSQPVIVTFENSTRLRAVAPRGGSGTVDIVVTNPDGQSVRLPAGFTYNVVTLTTNQTFVAPGAEIAVSWTATHTRCSSDWIGLYQPGMRNEDYGLWGYTPCGTGGTLRFNLTARGQFEFRYLPDDGFVDVARSVTITVE